MTPTEVAVFMEERKWDYRSMYSLPPRFTPNTAYAVFGFAASLLESIPIVGLVFTISNRIGAAMWAFGERFLEPGSSLVLIRDYTDLEKRQHHVAVQRREGVYPSSKDE